MKIHLCCGDVYLRGYHNVDAVGDLFVHSKPNQNETDFDNYYIGSVHDSRKPICDRLLTLPKGYDYEGSSVEEVLMVCAIEHFSLPEAIQLIDRIHFSIKPGGKFKFDVPDVLETVNIYKNNPEKMVRLLYGSGKNEYGFHKWGYTKDTLVDLLSRNGWSSIDFGEIVPHDYPMIGVTCTK